MARLALALVTLALALGCAPARPPSAAGQGARAPVDRPFGGTKDAWDAVDAAIAPLVEEAQASYPQARQRYLAGLPPGHRLFVTTRLKDSNGKFEQAFIEVKSIADGMIDGVIANDMGLVKDYARGQSHRFPESELLDWTIQRPDGSEEGNRVGQFLDYYRPGKVFAAIFGVVADTGGRAQSARLSMLTDPKSPRPTEALKFTPPARYVAAAKKRIATTRYERVDGKEFFVVFVFDPLAADEALDIETWKARRGQQRR